MGNDSQRSLTTVVPRLVASAETLAAVLVHLGHVSGEAPVDEETALRVRRLSEAVLDLDEVSPDLLRSQAAMGRAMLAQAAAFSATPMQPSSWAITDPFVLQTLGRGSGAFARLIIDEIAPRDERFVACLAGPTPRVLDVGTGVAALAIAFATALPSATVVGLDVWEPALELARANIEAAGLADRVSVRHEDVASFRAPESFDVAWFAGPFIPLEVQRAGLRRCVDALRPGGWLTYGAFGGGDDPIASALGDLRTLRSGGPVLTTDEITEQLRAAGLVDVDALDVNVGIASRVVWGRKP